MTDGRHKTPRGRRRSRSVPIRALLSLGVVVGFGAVGTMAYWTDQAIVTGGEIKSGTMDLQFDASGAIGLGTGYAKSTISWTGLTPGERKAFNLQVKNVGVPPFTYTATVTRGTTPAWTYVGTPVTVQFFTGTGSTDTTYPQQESCSGSALGTVQAVDGTNKALITTPPTVAGDGNQQICMVVGIASDATSNNQNKTGQLSFTFDATQVAP